MLHLVRKLFGGQASPASASPASARAPGAPSEVAGGAASAFRIAAHLRRQQGYPIFDWTAARRFVLAADMADGGAAAASEHLGADLGQLVCAGRSGPTVRLESGTGFRTRFPSSRG